MNTRSVYAFGRIVCDIAGVDEDDEDDDDDLVSNELLLSAQPMLSMMLNKNNVITGFTRARN